MVTVELTDKDLKMLKDACVSRMKEIGRIREQTIFNVDFLRALDKEHDGLAEAMRALGNHGDAE